LSIFDDVAGGEGNIFTQVAQEAQGPQGNIFQQVAQETAPEQPQQSWGTTALATAARIVPSIAGTIGGAALGSVVPVAGTTAGAVGGGMLGGGLGEWLAQQIEGRDSPGQIGLSAALGAIPGIPIAKGIGTLGRVGIRAAEGAGMGAVGQGASNLIEGRPVTENLGLATAIGAPLGAGAGVLERAIMGKARIAPEAPVAQAMPEQLDLIPPAPPNPQIASRIDQLMAEQAALKQDAQFMTSKQGTQREMFTPEDLQRNLTQDAADPLAPQSVFSGYSERQIKELNWRLRHAPETAAERALEMRVMQTPTRTLEVGAKILGAPTERGILSKVLGVNASDPLLPYKPSDLGLFLRKMGQESSAMVESFGPAGKQLVGMVRNVYDRFETELSQFLDGPKGILHTANRLKLTPAERANLFDVMEGTAPATNTNVAQVATLMKQQRDVIAARAGSLEIRDPMTGEVIPWQPRPDYMPHFIDFDQVAQDPRRLAKAVQDIQVQQSARNQAAGRPAITEADAQNIFNQMRRNSRQEYGHLEVARSFDFTDYERDGIKAWSQYVEGSLKRLNEAAMFGPKSEAVVSAIQHIGLTAGDDAAYAAQRYMTQVTGRDPLTGIRNIDSNASKIFNVARTLQVGFKLGQAVIANASQSNLTGLVTGYNNLYKGFQELRTTAGKDFARLAGATIEQTMRDMNEALGVGKFGGKVLELTGFSRVEQFNRMLAANSGKMFARDLVQRLHNGATGHMAEQYKRHLRKMGIEPMDVLARGVLTPDEEIKAARSVIERTQFKVRPQELPLYWNGPLGKLVTQFSSFGFKAAKAINEEVLREAKQKNFAPLVRFMLVSPLVGEVFADIQSVAKGGKERPENIIGRIADNYASLGAFGLFWDAFRATGYGELGILRRAVGPTVSDLTQVAAGIRDPKMLAKVLAQNVPIIGPALRPSLFPPKRRQEEDDDE
jgi:hypothetical protein